MISTHQIEATKKYLDRAGYEVVRKSPFSAARMVELRDLAANCLDKAMMGKGSSTREESAAICKLAILSTPLHERINKDYRFTHSMVTSEYQYSPKYN